MKAILYATVNNMAVDEKGVPSSVGLKIDYGVEAKKEVSVTELNNNYDLKKELAELLGQVIKPEDITFIPEEEYIRTYEKKEG